VKVHKGRTYNFNDGALSMVFVLEAGMYVYRAYLPIQIHYNLLGRYAYIPYTYISSMHADAMVDRIRAYRLGYGFMYVV
jgi:hypothetical protein